MSSIKAGLVAGVVLVATVLSGPAEARQCALPDQIRAIQSKSLETELMVAGLACGKMDQYQSFLQRYATDLRTNGKVLRGYFEKSYGSRGANQLDKLVTELANSASQKNNRSTVAFCQSADSRFGLLLGESKADLQPHIASQALDAQLKIVPCQ